MEIDPAYTGKIARMRNLRLYANKSDEEIYEAILRKEEEKANQIDLPSTDSKDYNQRLKKLVDKLQEEYGVDMNESNDVESLKMLASHTLQLENIDRQIRLLQEQKYLTNEDTRTLKNLGDFQRSLVTSISELQDRLGISRKVRKERKSDDVPAFIESLKNKAADYWQRSTTVIRCETCKIELGRYWLNFLNRDATVAMELQCERCEKVTMYVR